MQILNEKYRFGKCIGSGGMAEVFEGELIGALGFTRKVAIKRMRGASAQDAEFGRLFVNEAQMASLLAHPNIVTVMDFAQDNEDRFYIVMEFIDGVDLRSLLNTGRLRIEQTLFIIQSILRALFHAHHPDTNSERPPLVHRDVSPHNVMLSWKGAIKLVDFGIAKAIATTALSKSGALKGKVAYMSPEQAHGDSLDGRSDLFALGVLLHEMLSGERLFRGATDAETLSLMLTSPIAKPSAFNSDVSPELDDITLKLLERNKSKRYASAHHALRDLDKLAQSPQSGPQSIQRLLEKRFPEHAPQNPLRQQASLPTPLPNDSLLESFPAESPALGRTLTAPSEDSIVRPPTDLATPKRRVWLWAALLGGCCGLGMWRTLTRSHDDVSSSEVRVFENTPQEITTKKAVNAEPPPPLSIPQKSITQEDSATIAGPATSIEAKKTPSKERVMGTLTIKATPWAKIFVGKKSYGQTPKTIRLPVGRVTIRLVNEELGINKKRPLTIKAGKNKTFVENFDL